MPLKFHQTLFLPMLCLLLCGACAGSKSESWQLNQLENVDGYATTVLGDPKVIETSRGRALEFDGIDDGLLLETNPIAGAEEFMIEVVFKPYAGYPENREQRFLHIQDPENDKRRLLMELRLNSKDQWYPDLFMRTDSAALTLIDSTKTFPVGEWASLQMVYKNDQLRGYVNGEEVLSGAIKYMPISPSASTSVGVRMNKVSWFKGAIKSINFMPKPRQ